MKIPQVSEGHGEEIAQVRDASAEEAKAQICASLSRLHDAGLLKKLLIIGSARMFDWIGDGMLTDEDRARLLEAVSVAPSLASNPKLEAHLVNLRQRAGRGEQISEQQLHGMVHHAGKLADREELECARTLVWLALQNSVTPRDLFRVSSKLRSARSEREDRFWTIDFRGTLASDGMTVAGAASSLAVAIWGGDAIPPGVKTAIYVGMTGLIQVAWFVIPEICARAKRAYGVQD